MSANVILLLQSILIFFQMVNAAIGTMEHINPVVVLLLSAFVGSFQFYVNHLGNKIEPPPPSSHP